MPVQKTSQIKTAPDQSVQSKISELIQSNKYLVEELKSTTQEIKELTSFFKEAGKYMVAESEDEKLKPLLSRIAELVDQNKSIMRGLILIQKYIKTGPISQSQQNIFPE